MRVGSLLWVMWAAQVTLCLIACRRLGPGLWGGEPERAELLLKSQKGDFPGGPVALILPPNVGGLGSILGQGTRYYMPQLRSRILQLSSRIPQLRSRILQLRPGAVK